MADVSKEAGRVDSTLHKKCHHYSNTYIYVMLLRLATSGVQPLPWLQYRVHFLGVVYIYSGSWYVNPCVIYIWVSVMSKTTLCSAWEHLVVWVSPVARQYPVHFTYIRTCHGRGAKKSRHHPVWYKLYTNSNPGIRLYTQCSLARMLEAEYTQQIHEFPPSLREIVDPYIYIYTTQ